MLSRPAQLLGTTTTLAVGATGADAQQGLLPGRPWGQWHLGLNGEDGTVPDVAAGPVERGTFVSRARLGAPTRWALRVLPAQLAFLGAGVASPS